MNYFIYILNLFHHKIIEYFLKYFLEIRIKTCYFGRMLFTLFFYKCQKNVIFFFGFAIAKFFCIEIY